MELVRHVSFVDCPGAPRSRFRIVCPAVKAEHESLCSRRGPLTVQFVTNEIHLGSAGHRPRASFIAVQKAKWK